jgi:hypothetical protein
MKIFILTLLFIGCVSASKYLIFMEVDNSNESDSSESSMIESIILPSLLHYKNVKEGINFKDCGINLANLEFNFIFSTFL